MTEDPLAGSRTSDNAPPPGGPLLTMREKEHLTIGEMRASDREFVLEAFRAWKLDCYGFQNDRAWQVMADLACASVRQLAIVVVRDGDRVVAFFIVVTDPGEFWPLFLSRLGPATLLAKMANSFVQTIWKTVSLDRRRQRHTDGPTDEEFARLTERAYQSTEGVARGLFSYVDPHYRKPPTAFLMYRRMFQQLQSKGFERLEGQIRFGNEPSVRFHRALGFDIRNAGSCLHGVKHLAHGQ